MDQTLQWVLGFIIGGAVTTVAGFAIRALWAGTATIIESRAQIAAIARDVKHIREDFDREVQARKALKADVSAITQRLDRAGIK